MSTRIFAPLGLLAAILVTPVAQAQLLQPGWYFEIAVGDAKFKDVAIADVDALTRDFFDSFDLPVLTLSSTLSTKDRSFALISGYRINPNLSVEAGYFRLGAFQYASTGTVSDAGTTLPSAFDFSFRAKGVLLGGAATLPLGNYLEARARAGLSSSETRIRLRANVDGDTVSDQVSESSQDLYYGVGVGMRVLDYYRIGVDWLHHHSVGRSSGNGSSDVDNVMLTIGFEY